MERILQLALCNAIIATLLALIVIALGRWIRRPAILHALWLLVFLKLFTPPLISIPISIPSQSPVLNTEPTYEPRPNSPSRHQEQIIIFETMVDAAMMNHEENCFTAEAAIEEPLHEVHPSTAEESQFPWWSLLGWTWMAGSFCWLILAVSRIWRFHHLLRYADSAPAWLQREVQFLAKKLGLNHVPDVLMTPGRLSPMLWALGRPRLLMPKELLPSLTVGQRQALLVHELAHLRRWDHVVRSVEMLALCLYWWNPIVWWAKRALREAEEQCCDAWVIWALPEERRNYATALVECLDFLANVPRPLPMGASGLGQVTDLKRRLTMILGSTTPRRLNWLSGMTMLILGALLLPILPTFAEDKDEKKKGVNEERRIRIRVLKDAAEAKKSTAEVQKLKAMVEKYRAVMKQTEKALANAEAKLKALESKELKVNPKNKKDINVDVRRIVIVGSDGKPKVMQWRTEGGQADKKAIIGIQGDWLKNLPKDQAEKIKEALKKAGISGNFPMKGIHFDPKGKWSEEMKKKFAPGSGGTYRLHFSKDQSKASSGDSKKIAELEKKLNAVLKELEHLRKKVAEK